MKIPWAFEKIPVPDIFEIVVFEKSLRLEFHINIPLAPPSGALIFETMVWFKRLSFAFHR